MPARSCAIGTRASMNSSSTWVPPLMPMTAPPAPESWSCSCSESTLLVKVSRRHSVPNTTWMPSEASGDLMPYTPRSPLTVAL